MPKYLKRNLRKRNKQSGKENVPALEKMRKRIIWQAGLAASTIALTIVIVFAVTAAWRSNVVQTSGLQFQAEAWGFEGDIEVDENAILIAPGDQGAVTLSVNNSNEDAASVRVNVSKALLNSGNAIQMRKRLYLYVDAQNYSSGEVMDRVYLNSQEGYVYTLLGGQTLTLSDTVYNGPQLKWQWVYDVLGYYVRGTKTSDGDVSVEEYLRPIEYEYDEATTVFEMKDGFPQQLLSIRGQSVDDFMVELSKTDGYEGTIDVSQKLESGYYPVVVDDNGYGVYAYLCNYGEIEYATQFDSMLGEQAAKQESNETFVLELTVSAQNEVVNVKEVSNLTQLQDALTQGTADVIRFTDDIKVSNKDGLVIPKGNRVILDLGGYTCTNIGSATKIITVEEGANLTVFNGNIVGKKIEQAINVTGAEVLISDVNISKTLYGVYVADNKGSIGLDSKVHILNSTITTQNHAVYVYGNGTVSDMPTQVVIESCTIQSTQQHAVVGSDTDNTWGRDIQILNSKIISDTKVGVYLPLEGNTLMVYKSVITSNTGITIMGGTAHVVNSTVEGTGTVKKPQSYVYTGDGILIKATDGYPIVLEISEGSTITSEYGQSLQVYESDAENVTVKIYSGTFDEAQPEDYIDKNSVQNGSVVTPKG